MHLDEVLIHLKARLSARETLYKSLSNDLDFDRDKAAKTYRRTEDAIRILEGKTPQYSTVEMVVWELEHTVFQLEKWKAAKTANSIAALKLAVKIISSPQKLAQ